MRKKRSFIKREILHDPIHPAHWNHLKMKISCEDCSLYAPTKNWCTLGHNTHPHRRQNQKHRYELTGKVALCRFLEID